MIKECRLEREKGKDKEKCINQGNIFDKGSFKLKWLVSIYLWTTMMEICRVLCYKSIQRKMHA